MSTASNKATPKNTIKGAEVRAFEYKERKGNNAYPTCTGYTTCLRTLSPLPIIHEKQN
jgi:hypothetical protein